MKKKGFLQGLLGFKKKDEEKTVQKDQVEKDDSDLIIKVLGSGCRNCKTLEQNAKEALNRLEISAGIEKITDFEVIAGYGVMSTPALVVNEKVISAGRVLEVAEIVELLQEEK